MKRNRNRNNKTRNITNPNCIINHSFNLIIEILLSFKYFFLFFSTGMDRFFSNSTDDADTKLLDRNKMIVVSRQVKLGRKVDRPRCAYNVYVKTRTHSETDDILGGVSDTKLWYRHRTIITYCIHDSNKIRLDIVIGRK